MEGWHRLEAQKGFTKSLFVDRKVKQIHLYSDVVARFIDECMEKGSAEDFMEFNALYNCFTEFHDSEGEGGKALKKNGFTRRLQKDGFSKDRKWINNAKQWVVYGVKSVNASSHF